MRIIIGSDHAGYAMKEKVKAYLHNINVDTEDVGTYNEESVDYPDYAKRVASKISDGTFERGILVCGSGVGMSMAANRFPKVRAALANDLYTAKMSRQHNDSNILVMGGRVIGESLAEQIVKTWLDTPWEGGRHKKRLEKIDIE